MLCLSGFELYSRWVHLVSAARELCAVNKKWRDRVCWRGTPSVCTFEFLSGVATFDFAEHRKTGDCQKSMGWTKAEKNVKWGSLRGTESRLFSITARHNNQFSCDHFPPTPYPHNSLYIGTVSLGVSSLGCSRCFRNFGQFRTETFLKLRVVYSAV